METSIDISEAKKKYELTSIKNMVRNLELKQNYISRLELINLKHKVA